MTCAYRALIVALTIVGCRGQTILNLPEGSSCVKDGIKGKCVGFYNCPTVAMVDLKQTPIRDVPICSFQDTYPIVCCTDCVTQVDVRQMVVTVGGIMQKSRGKHIAWDKCLEYIDTLPYRCKDNRDTEVVKDFYKKRNCTLPHVRVYMSLIGYAAERGLNPHMALLGYGGNRSEAEWLCGGSVISDRYILTAAHCRAQGQLGEVRHVALGILRRSDPPSRWQLRGVRRFLPHPEYEYPIQYHDVALIETDTPIEFGREVLPACVVDNYFVKKDYAWVVGWGAIGEHGQLADNLQQARLNLFTEKECKQQYPPSRLLPRGFDPDTQYCYGDMDHDYDTCQGDSGGPLQLLGIRTLYCSTFLIGVTSHGRGCGHRGAAGVYTRLLHYVPWITSVVWPVHTRLNATLK